MWSILRGWSGFMMANLVKYYLKKKVTKATRPKIMVIGIHKCSNIKRINAMFVKDFKTVK